ncbi:MAG: hypothetical protein ACPLKX_04000 [Dictyoglomaceae bacterium]
MENLKNFSRELGIAVIGNAIVKENGLKNRAFLFDAGKEIGFQDKIHPKRVEKSFGINPGNKLSVFEVKGVKVCRFAGIKGTEIAFNPVISFKKTELREKVTDIAYTSQCLSITDMR